MSPVCSPGGCGVVWCLVCLMVGVCLVCILLYSIVFDIDMAASSLLSTGAFNCQFILVFFVLKGSSNEFTRTGICISCPLCLREFEKCPLSRLVPG